MSAEALDYINELRAHIREQDKRIAALETDRQGYYNEASEGWTKYRKAEKQIATLKAELKDVKEAWKICDVARFKATEENAHLRRMLSKYQECES